MLADWVMVMRGLELQWGDSRGWWRKALGLPLATRGSGDWREERLLINAASSVVTRGDVRDDFVGFDGGMFDCVLDVFFGERGGLGTGRAPSAAWGTVEFLEGGDVGRRLSLSGSSRFPFPPPLPPRPAAPRAGSEGRKFLTFVLESFNAELHPVRWVGLGDVRDDSGGEDACILEC